MKITFLIPFLFLLPGCSSKGNVEQTGQKALRAKDQDTVIVARIMPVELSSSNNFRTEYFVVVGKDTSSTSIEANQNKIYRTVSLRWSKPTFKYASSYSPSDTAATEEIGDMKPYRDRMYAEQLKEFELILGALSKDYDLNQLKSIKLIMSAVDGLSESITDQYVKVHGEKFSRGSDASVVDLFKKAKITTDINNLLHSFNLAVNKISIEGMVYYKVQGKEHKKLLDGIIIISYQKSERNARPSNH